MITLSKSEKQALLVFTSVLVVAYGVQWLGPAGGAAPRFDYAPADSLYDVLAADTLVRTTETELKKNVRPPKTAEKKNRRRKKSIKKLPPLKSIDINSATKNDLVKLPHIGPVTARNILEYRRENGPFRSIRDLLKVKRIGPKTLEKISPFLLIGDTLK
ncbi:MAG TPA: helix-hairpin-helix domain-containing protein [Caldithrix abyssi]|uniref:Helix-hairpin-helix domain-containing protein n=1 Tax=Caldithrix abyssi TaxID=187145 RepID=A0A7V5RN21_CALAY|nr:helix-hairpin-helix domain-containing protein [Caldithrix abyssi]